MVNHPFDIPESKKIRLIINTDAKNEADDQFAIVHALLTPRFDIRGIIAAHFGERRTTTSMQESYDEIVKLLALMKLTGEVNVLKGAEKAIPDEQTPAMSEGAELIIREALADDPKPLYVIFLGPITDLAAAYLQEPSIADKLTAVWIRRRRLAERRRRIQPQQRHRCRQRHFSLADPAVGHSTQRVLDDPRKHCRARCQSEAVRGGRRIFVPTARRFQSSDGLERPMAQRRDVEPGRFAGGQRAAG